MIIREKIEGKELRQLTYFVNVVSQKDLSYRIDANYYSINALNDEKLIKKSDYDYLDNRLNKMASGGTPTGANYLEQGVLFIRTQNVKSNMVDVVDGKYISLDDDKALRRSRLKKYDVLLTITGVDLGRSAVVPEQILPANINQHSVKMEIENLDPYFLSVFLNSRYGQSQIWRRVYGATRPAINYEEIKDMIIPTPEFSIQQYIGKKIRKAEELHEEAKHLKKQAFDKLNKSLFLEELEISLKGINSKFNWIDCNLEDRLDAEYYKREYTLINEHLERYAIKVQPLRELVREKIVSGSTPSDLEKRIIQGRHYFIKANKLDGYSISSNLDLIDDEGERLLRSSIVNCGDILLSIAGSIGISSVVPKSISQACINQALVRIRPKEKEINYYLCFVLNHFSIHFSNRQANGAVQKNLNRDEVGKILIPRIDIETEKIINCAIEKFVMLIGDSNQLINEAKRDVEDLIEGKFEHSKITETV